MPQVQIAEGFAIGSLGNWTTSHMQMVRLFLALISFGLGLLCGLGAWFLHSARRSWLLGGPLDVWGYTVSNQTAVQALAALAVVFLVLVACALLGSKSED
jgi:hypothetical protein